MKYAKLVKLGGELIEAKDADYQDYYGILTCPECGEPVFLRKGHQRGETVFRPAFVHHKAIPEISACEMRVGSYSLEYVQRVAGEARNQRIRKLEISMWKYLKTCKGLLNSHRWLEASNLANSSQEDTFIATCVSRTVEKAGVKWFLDGFSRRQEQLEELNNYFGGLGVKNAETDGAIKFLRAKQRNWDFHCKISKEALEVFLSSNYLEKIRMRWFKTLCFKESRSNFDLTFTKFPDFTKELSTEEITLVNNFMFYITFCTATAFLTVDWIEILNVNQEEQKPSRGFATSKK